MFPKDFEPKDLLFLDKMLTPAFMTLIYRIAGALIILGSLISILGMRSFRGFIVGLISLVFGLIITRISFEIFTIFFKINSNLQKIADKE